MGRSYFSRVVGRGSTAPLLLPARPISSLWKSAKLEQQPFQEFDTRETTVPKPAARVSPRTDGDADPSVRAVELPHPNNSVGREPGRSSLDAGVEKEQATRIVKTSVSTVDAHPGSEAALHPSAIEPPMEKVKTESLDMTPPADENRPRLEIAQHRPRESSPVNSRSVTPAIRESAKSRPAPETAKSKANQVEPNSIHIGRIEVQVVSPPTPVRRANPFSPKSRLARGYSFWQS